MIVNKFSEFLTENNLDKRDAVRLTGLDNHIIDKIYKKQVTRIDIKTLDKLCKGLRCNTIDIFYYTDDE